jgi:cytosine/creatinine deaminase
VAGLLIRNARAPGCLLASSAGTGGGDGFLQVDITISEGVIRSIEPARTVQQQTARGAESDVIDLDGGIVLPRFVECHTHLDKGHVWPRTPNPDGTFMGALESVSRDRETSWSAADVAARMDFALRSAEHHGVGAIRTHLDSIGTQIGISWPVFAEMRDRWKDRVALQAAPLFGIQSAVDPAHMAAIIAAVRAHGSGIIGTVTYMCPELEAGLDILFRAAMDNGWDLDFHVDESSDPAARSLERIAMAAIRHGFKGRILCGHCCALALQGPVDEARVISLVKQAGISVVSLPMCNMYLQDRQRGRTPRWRGTTSLHELKAAGVPVMVSSDNTRDPFYAYGDLDTLEVFRESVRILQLDHPMDDWVSAITTTPADVMGLAGHGRIGAGLAADLVLFRARSWTELLSRPQHDRVVLRHGKKLATTLPDYRELDGLRGMGP